MGNDVGHMTLLTVYLGIRAGAGALPSSEVGFGSPLRVCESLSQHKARSTFWWHLNQMDKKDKNYRKLFKF